jgi:hypothetical protein
VGYRSAAMQPVFMLALPRSGSTLVQRVLGSHPEITTVSEPWLLLPYLYAMRDDGIRAEYWHATAVDAMRDFIEELPGGEADYDDALREFAMRLYRSAGDGDATYFLDKTPHYHAVADELRRLFPDARFVVLYRNPLAILTSLLSTFRHSRFEPYMFDFDLFTGIENLTQFARRQHDVTHVARYEDLVGEERESHWRAMFGSLGLEFDPELLESFGSLQLNGRYGDRLRSPTMSGDSVEKWKPFVAGRVRKAWCRHWLRWIGRRRLAEMGYDLDELLGVLEALPTVGIGGTDFVHLATSFAGARRRARMLALPDSPSSYTA